MKLIYLYFTGLLLATSVFSANAFAKRCFIQGTAYYVDLDKLPKGSHAYELTLSMEGRVIERSFAIERLTIGGADYLSPNAVLTLTTMGDSRFDSDIVSGICNFSR